MRFLKSFFFAALLLAVAASGWSEDATSKISLHVQSFTLKNGMMFLVVERPTTPQVACRVAIRAGSALEDSGKTGLAHMLEHMMFKGTKNFGTTNIKKDQALQLRIEKAYQTIQKEGAKRNPDTAVIETKRAEMNQLRTQVQKIYVPNAFSAQLEKNGAVGVNAFTSKDQTQFLASMPSDMIEQWFSIVSEQLFEPSWREFYVEREVIQREWAFRYINNPNGAAWLDLFATAYQAHPYKNPVIGWKSDMERFTTEDAMRFHKTYYTPSNAVCVLVGNITLDQAKTLAGIYFERYPKGTRAPERVTREPVQQGPRKNIRYLKGARTPLVRIGFHAAKMGTKDFYALDVISSILSEGRSARMTQQVVEKGLALNAWGYNPDNRYGSLFVLGGSPVESDALKNENISEEEKRKSYQAACKDLENILLAQVETLKTELVTERELSRVKKLSERAFLDRMRSNEQMAETLATLEVEVGWEYLTGYLDNLAAVTPDQIRDVAKKFFTTENHTTIFVIPGGMPDKPPEEYTEIRSTAGTLREFSAKPADLKNHSIYPTPKGWKHPLSFVRRPEKIVYPKVKPFTVKDSAVFFLTDKELPLIDLYLVVKAGEVDVSDTKQGLSGILNGSVIRGGTEDLSPSELALALDENGIYLSVAVQEEETVVSLSVMKEDWEKGLSLLRQVLTAPRFDPDVLAVTKQQALTALKRQGGDAMAVGRREIKIQHFKGHVYGRDPLKGLETIPTVSREDVKAFMKHFFVSKNTTVAVAGDIEEPLVVSGVRSLLDELSADQKPKRDIPSPMETPPVLALIPKPGQVQSQVWMALPSVLRTNPDYWKLNLLVDVLGGSNSLMYTRLRDDLGLVYSTGFFETYKWKAGMLMGYIGCKADKTAQAIGETVQIMKALRDNVPEDLLEQKRMDILNGFVFNVDTPSALVKTYATYHMRKEPLDTLERIQEAFISATKSELGNLARKFLDPKKLQVVIVGDKNIQVQKKDGTDTSLEQDLVALGRHLDIPFREIPLR